MTTRQDLLTRGQLVGIYTSFEKKKTLESQK
jgi:hypothetical protein